MRMSIRNHFCRSEVNEMQINTYFCSVNDLNLRSLYIGIEMTRLRPNSLLLLNNGNMTVCRNLFRLSIWVCQVKPSMQ